MEGGLVRGKWARRSEAWTTWRQAGADVQVEWTEEDSRRYQELEPGGASS
jgi:hypothetical protein